jgi:hypothetical protein
VQLVIIKVFYSPTDAQENGFKKNIKIYIKAAPTYFGLIAIIRERIIEHALASSIIRSLMHKRTALKRILKSALKQLRHISV